MDQYTGAVIRLYGDSLGLPRFSDGIPYHKTYGELLTRRLSDMRPEQRFHFYNRSKPAATAPQLLQEFESDCGYFGPDTSQIILIQCGVCDCAFRPLPRWLRPWISRLPGPFRRVIVKFLHNNRARMIKSGLCWREVSPAEFRIAFSALLARAQPEAGQIRVINIAPTVAAMEVRSPGFDENILAYNTIVADAVAQCNCPRIALVNVYEAIANETTIEQFVNAGDGHHITVAGHQMYADMLFASLTTTD